MNKKDLTRRSFLRASSAAGLLAATAPLGIAKAASAGGPAQGKTAAANPNEDAKMWPIPSCAWSRPLGILPKTELRPEKDKDSGDLIGLNTLTRTKKGIPLGGIGAGNFMYNLCGSFGPWQMKVGRYEERFPRLRFICARRLRAAKCVRARWRRMMFYRHGQD
jgi:hypothetical protein